MVNKCLLRGRGRGSTVAALSPGTEDSRWTLRELNRAIGEIAAAYPWRWTKAETEIALRPVQTGTVTLTNRSTGFTVTPMSLTQADTSAFMVITLADATIDVVVIGVVTNAISGTLKSAWVGDTGDYTCSILQSAYALPSDFARPINQNSYVTASWRMREVGPLELMQRIVSSGFTLYGQPTYYSRWGGGSTYMLQVWPFPADAATISVRYFKTPTYLTADADIPCLPAEFEGCLISRVLAHYFRDREPDSLKRGIHENQWRTAVLRAISRQRSDDENTSIRPYDETSDVGEVLPTEPLM